MTAKPPVPTPGLRKIRPIRLIIGSGVAAIGLFALAAGLWLAHEPFPHAASLAVGMPVGILIGTCGLCVLLVGAWLAVSAIGPRPEA